MHLAPCPACSTIARAPETAFDWKLIICPDCGTFEIESAAIAVLMDRAGEIDRDGAIALIRDCVRDAAPALAHVGASNVAALLPK